MIARPPSAPESRPSVALPTMPGSGLFAISNVLGNAFSAPQNITAFGHPWTPFLGSGVLTLSHGLVDTITPKIGKLPMTDPRAALKLDAGKVNDQGESWAVLEVEPNADTGLLDKDSRVEIVQLAEVDLHAEKIGRQPLALLLWRNKKTPQRALPIAFFNLKYLRVQPGPGGGPVRHLFL